MNINQNINKLLYALKQKGQFYKINSFQFYSEKNDKYCTKYQVTKKELVEVYNVETEENVSTIDSMCAKAHETMV